MSLTEFEGLGKDNVQAIQASINTMTATFNTVDIELTPTPGASEVQLNVSGRCEQTAVPVRIKLDIREPHKNNVAIPLVVS
jgi:hypothetical protein